MSWFTTIPQRHYHSHPQRPTDLVFAEKMPNRVVFITLRVGNIAFWKWDESRISDASSIFERLRMPKRR